MAHIESEHHLHNNGGMNKVQGSKSNLHCLQIVFVETLKSIFVVPKMFPLAKFSAELAVSKNALICIIAGPSLLGTQGRKSKGHTPSKKTTQFRQTYQI